MRIGYACLTRGVVGTDFKSCVIRNATQDKLKELISYNLNSLKNILDYNSANGIQIFRISSDIIPFGSNRVNDLKWWELFDTQLNHLGNQIKKSGMRVSMHPGQYTVLNSPDEGVVERAILDLSYHSRFLDSLGVDTKNKIILHVGGVYGNKEKAINDFCSNYRYLSEAVKQRLVIENDDKSYHIKDVLTISNRIGTPVVFDNLHNITNPSEENYSQQFWVKECGKTWKSGDGPQKIHYSQQNPDKKQGSHSENIRIEEFLQFMNEINEDNLDVMLEVKDKNISAIKCINCLIPRRSDFLN